MIGFDTVWGVPATTKDITTPSAAAAAAAV